jgi:hypothetical protein
MSLHLRALAALALSLSVVTAIPAAAGTPAPAGKGVTITDFRPLFCDRTGYGSSAMTLANGTGHEVKVGVFDQKGGRAELSPVIPIRRHKSMTLHPYLAPDTTRLELWKMEGDDLAYRKVKLLGTVDRPSLDCTHIEVSATISDVDPQTCTTELTVDNTGSTGPVRVEYPGRAVDVAPGAVETRSIRLTSDDLLPSEGADLSARAFVYADTSRPDDFDTLIDTRVAMECADPLRDFYGAAVQAPLTSAAGMATATVVAPKLDFSCSEDSNVLNTVFALGEGDLAYSRIEVSAVCWDGAVEESVTLRTCPTDDPFDCDFAARAVSPGDKLVLTLRRTDATAQNLTRGWTEKTVGTVQSPDVIGVATAINARAHADPLTVTGLSWFGQSPRKMPGMVRVFQTDTRGRVVGHVARPTRGGSVTFSWK